MTSVDLIRAAAVSPTCKRISRAASADLAKGLAATSYFLVAAAREVQEAIQFRLWHAVVAAAGFDGAQLAGIDPLFQGGIGNAQPDGGFSGTQGGSHKHTILYDSNRYFTLTQAFASVD